MSAPEAARAFRAAIASAKASQDWSSAIRNFPLSLHGVVCNVHLKAQVFWQTIGANPRLSGECFVYVTARSEGELVGGTGWIHFAMSEAAAARAELLFDLACSEAFAELTASPAFLARVEALELAKCAASPNASRRRRSL